MAEHIWSLLCERQLIDPDSGVISLMDVRESVSVAGLEAMLEDAVQQGKRGTLLNVPTLLVSWWTRSNNEEEGFQARFRFVSPDDECLAEHSLDFSWQVGIEHTRIVMKFDQLPCSMPGIHRLHVERKREDGDGEPQWEPITRIPIKIGPA